MTPRVSDQAYYKDGYNPYVSKTHSWRSAKNCSSYMLSYIKPTDKILDVGCGPGSITCDLAGYVPQGEVVGIEPTEELLDEAVTINANKVKNVKFEKGSVYKLPYDDNTFDIIHAHQVILHLEDRVEALKEMKRVVKPNGYVCSRDADISSLIVYPSEYHDNIWNYFNCSGIQSLTHTSCGRFLKELALCAGFSSRDINATAGCWCIADDDDRPWFMNMYIERIQNTKAFGNNGGVSRNDIIDTMKRWSEDQKGWLSFVHGEIVCQKK